MPLHEVWHSFLNYLFILGNITSGRQSFKGVGQFEQVKMIFLLYS